MKRYARWLTILATLLLGALLAGSVWLTRTGGGGAAGAPVPEVDPLRRFDTLIGQEAIEAPLRPTVLREAESFLAVVLARKPAAGDARAAATAAGARARLAVIRGEAGRLDDALAEARRANAGEMFELVLRCAYGAGPRGKGPAGCAAPLSGTYGATVVADARRRAGLWTGSRACLTALWNAKLPDAQRALLAETAKALAAAHPWEERSSWITIAVVAAGLAAAGALRRRPRPDAAPLPAPWTPAALHAALVRCGLYALLGTVAVGVPVGLASPGAVGAVAGAAVYLLGLVLMARLVFRRFGLSILDGFDGVRAGGGAGELALIAVAALGFDRAGRIAVTLPTLLFTDVSPSWWEVPSLLDQPFSVTMLIELATIVLLGPLVEELLFRRVLFVFLRDRWGALRAGLATSVVFGLLHLYSPAFTAAIVWAGLVFAWALHRSGSVWPGLAAHAVGNALALLAASG
jgi:membrane protease YdiL (CAAX protease family)